MTHTNRCRVNQIAYHVLIASLLVFAVGRISAAAAAKSRRDIARLSYTHQRFDGNRPVSGRGALPRAVALDIPLCGKPQWLVAAPVAGGSVWVAVLADGRVQAFQVIDRYVSSIAVTPPRLPRGMR